MIFSSETLQQLYDDIRDKIWFHGSDLIVSYRNVLAEQSHWLTVKFVVTEGRCDNVSLEFNRQTFRSSLDIKLLKEIITRLIRDFGYLAIDVALDPKDNFLTSEAIFIQSERGLLLLDHYNYEVDFINNQNTELDRLFALLDHPNVSHYYDLYGQSLQHDSHLENVLDVSIHVPIDDPENFVLGLHTLEDLCLDNSRFQTTKRSV